MRPVQQLDRRFRYRIIAAGVLSLVAWVTLQVTSPPATVVWSAEMLEAANRMQRAIAVTAEYCDSAGIAVDGSLDLNHTCMIGPEYTPLFTTLGQLEAKRTTVNPDVAALIIHLLDQAGVEAGDTVAVGASASFPALLIATQAAVEAMHVHPKIVLSLGASSYGATRPEFNLLEIHELLLRENVLVTPAVAVSLGGEADTGAEFDPALRAGLARQIEAYGRLLLRVKKHEFWSC